MIQTWEILSEVPVKINDVTLREWDQAPLTSFIADEKKIIALMLHEIWVNAIEAWFASSRAEFENVRWVVEMFQNIENAPTITSLWRAVDKDTVASLKALKWYKNARVHIVMATSDQHIQAKFPNKWNNKQERREWVLAEIIRNIWILKKYKDKVNPNLEIEFSPEDATWNALARKTDGKRYLDFQSDDFEFLITVIRAAIEAWANIINTPDTLWNFLPHQSEMFFKEMVKRTQDLQEKYTFEFSSHIHNDMASASNGAISAVRWWARQIEVTTVGIWERTWNTSLHEVVWIITNAGHSIVDNAQVVFSKKLQTELVWPVTRFVEWVLSLNKWLQTPFIGALSDVDGSGIHTAAVSVYGGTKNKADFWWETMEEFFSPRSWSTQIQDILTKTFSVNADKRSSIIQKITQRACTEAETVKALYPARIYAMYLEEARDLKIWKIEIHGNYVKIPIHISWKDIVLEWTWSWENGIIDATIQAINAYVWKDVIDVEDIDVKNKPSLRTLYERFEKEVSVTSVALSRMFQEKAMQIIWNSNNGHGSEQIWVVHMVLNVWWKQINIRSAGQNTDEATVKAIIYGALPAIVNK